MTDEPPSHKVGIELIVEPIWAAMGKPTRIDANLDLGLHVLASKCTGAVLARLKVQPADGVEVSFRFTDDATVRALNGTWRGRDRATDVLSFPASEPGEAPLAGCPLILGDVVLAFETCRQDARELARPLHAHVAHLLVHGLLHLMHHDHDAPATAARMEALEVTILQDLGLPDPYAGRPLIEESS